MEDFSPLSQPRRIPLAMPNPAWLQDHRFLGQAVLPGVWALEQLARTVGRVFPEVALTACTAMRFEKFLTLPPPDIEVVDAVVDLTPSPDGAIEAALLTRHVAPKSGISRMKTHARACFGQPRGGDDEWASKMRPDGISTDAFQVAPDRLYGELVPFGRIFRNIVSTVRLDAGGARATVAGGIQKMKTHICGWDRPFPWMRPSTRPAPGPSGIAGSWPFPWRCSSG